MAVAVVERWPLWRGLSKSKCVNCPSGQNKVAVVERWPEIRKFHVFIVILSRAVTVKKCTKKRDTRAKLSFHLSKPIAL